ncbi:hypothetical protein SARC_01893, partial [Sphaeroforma arctica JP610]
YFRGLEDIESEMNSSNHRVHKQCLRMPLVVFEKFTMEIKKVYKPDGRANVGVHEMLYMWLTFAGQKMTQAYLARIFRRSTQKVFNGIRNAIYYINLALYKKYIVMPTKGTPVPSKIRNNTR